MVGPASLFGRPTDRPIQLALTFTGCFCPCYLCGPAQVTPGRPGVFGLHEDPVDLIAEAAEQLRVSLTSQQERILAQVIPELLPDMDVQLEPIGGALGDRTNGGQEVFHSLDLSKLPSHQGGPFARAKQNKVGWGSAAEALPSISSSLVRRCAACVACLRNANRRGRARTLAAGEAAPPKPALHAHTEGTTMPSRRAQPPCPRLSPVRCPGPPEQVSASVCALPTTAGPAAAGASSVSTSTSPVPGKQSVTWAVGVGTDPVEPLDKDRAPSGR